MKRWWLILCFAAVTAQADEKWPLVYNQGVTAYRSNDFPSAVTSFERATASPDRLLQGKAFYNLGDTYYRIGQATEAQGPEQAMPVFKKSLKAYEDTLAFNPKDADAQFNRDLVKKKIEELQKEQQQQQDQQKQNQQNKKKDDQKQDQQKDQQQQQQDQQSQQQKQNQDHQKEEQKKQQEQARQQEKEREKEGQQDQKKQQQQQAQQQAGQANSLEKVQAQMILDNLREDERNWNFFPEVQMKDLKDKGGPVKDW